MGLFHFYLLCVVDYGLITTLCAFQVFVTKLGTREIRQTQINLCPRSAQSVEWGAV